MRIKLLLDRAYGLRGLTRRSRLLGTGTCDGVAPCHPGHSSGGRWRVEDELGQEFRTSREETVFTDDRFEWQSHTDGHITYYWYAGGDDFGQRLADGARDGLETLQLGQGACGAHQGVRL